MKWARQVEHWGIRLVARFARFALFARFARSFAFTRAKEANAYELHALLNLISNYL